MKPEIVDNQDSELASRVQGFRVQDPTVECLAVCLALACLSNLVSEWVLFSGDRNLSVVDRLTALPLIQALLEFDAV